MTAPPSAAAIRSAANKWLAGRHSLYPGWETRTRPGGIDVHGLLQHHTGGPFTHSASYLEFLFETGRPSEGIPGPLCNFATDDLGTVHIGSRGRTNNAGSGYRPTLDHVIAEDYAGYSSPELRPGADNFNDGNGNYWGNEIMYPGTVPMRPIQYESSVLLGAMVMDLFGWSALSMAAHREHSSRKNDPYGVKLYDFRTDVKAALAQGPTWRLDDMDQETFTKYLLTALTNMDVRKALVRAVLATDDVIPAPNSAPDKETNPHWFGYRFLQETVDDLDEISTKLDAAPPPGTTVVSDLTPEALAKIGIASVDEQAQRLQKEEGSL